MRTISRIDNFDARGDHVVAAISVEQTGTIGALAGWLHRSHTHTHTHMP